MPGYTLEHPLGPRVWAATRQRDGAPAALKLPRDEQSARREAAVLQRVRHPNLVALAEVIEGGGGPTLVLPRAQTSLHDLRAANGPLAPGEVVAVGVAVAGALAALHRRGLVHGDVHPANVLVTTEGAPVLADVETASPVGAPVACTPGFTAPEVVAGGPTSARADQWSLAATCAACLGPDVPTPVAVVLTVAMAADPTDRFDDVPAFAAALAHAHPKAPLGAAFARTSAAARWSRRIPPPTTRRFGPRPPRQGSKRRAPGPVALLALAVAALAAGVAIALRLPDGGGAAPATAAPCDRPAPTTQPGDRLVAGTCPLAVQRGDVLIAEVTGQLRRYRFGQPGDVFVLGDWTCTGTRTPGLYRPGTGEALEFTTWEPGDDGAPPTKAAQLPPGLQPRVERTGEGCDAITTSTP